MSGYRPTVAIEIAKPCSESWEAMPGDARVRHCGGCDRDVHNLAAMTPAQIEAMLAQPGPKPCMRLVQFEDGSLMAARVAVRRSFFQRAALTLSTAMLAVTTSVAQDAHPAGSNDAILQGVVVDPAGTPIPHATVELKADGKRISFSETDKDGVFTLHSVPGIFLIDAVGTGFAMSSERRVEMVKGARKLSDAISLNVVSLMGDVVIPNKPMKTKKLKQLHEVASETPAPPPAPTSH
jgi:hypothetical protein